MYGCQRSLLTALAVLACICAALTAPAPASEAQKDDGDAKFVVIAEDIIPDIENTTQKVIRVNPLDLPSKADNTGSTDSTLFNIQTLRPLHKVYRNSSEMRRKRPAPAGDSKIVDSVIFRQAPGDKFVKPRHAMQKKAKHLQFMYEHEDPEGLPIVKSMRVHMAPGAYPVYYAVAKTNGRFGKYPIKGFSTQAEFVKYLLKSKSLPAERVAAFVS